ncbi:MAG: outer membrane protein assembly factor BamA [Alphaproteobacteria bacterium]|nr:outer membrane protein assembly factor BamA [Alphaproteobacteria bacterium]
MVVRRLLPALVLVLIAGKTWGMPVTVTGNQRVAEGTVLANIRGADGPTITSSQLDRIVKDLHATGLFSDISVDVRGGRLYVNVQENPTVNRVYFDGNKRVSEEDIAAARLRLSPREVFTRTKAKEDAERIVELYRRRGMFNARVTPQVIRRDQNRVDVIFAIDEGERAFIRRIRFAGNERFSDSELRSELMSRRKAWWRFLSSVDTFDPQRFAFDQELLRRFYFSKGYADFQIRSAVAQLINGSDFVLTITVSEGPRYRFGDIRVVSPIPEITEEQILKVLRFRTGDWFNGNSLEDSLSAISDYVADRGYAFVNAVPEIKTNPETRRADIVLTLTQGPRFFINRINITGNVRTKDNVIRREITIAEGDGFSSSKIRRSRQRIENLDFFSRVSVTTEPNTGMPDRVDLNVDIEEKSTGSISFALAFSTLDGASFETGIRENNVLGTGLGMGISGRLGSRRSEVDFSITQPYFMGRPVLAGLDLFYITRNLQSQSSYNLDTVGFTTRLGWRYNENLRHRVSYTLRQEDVTDVKDTASIYVKARAGRSTVSMVSQMLTYDTRDSMIMPSSGVQSTIGTDLAGLGGDRRFVRFDWRGVHYYPVTDGITLSTMLGAGYMFGFGGREVDLGDRYYIGGHDVRGFAYYGIGTRDKLTRDGLGGNWMGLGSVQATFPIGLPKESGVRGQVFSDWGIIGKPDGFDAATMYYSNRPRGSVGVGLSWMSPMGAIGFDFAWAVNKEPYDVTEVFRLGFGGRF